MVSMDRVVVIMAKAPISGQAKTRLIPRLGPEQAAMLYQHMLLDTIELVAEALDGSGTISLVCPTDADRMALQPIVPSAMQILADGQGSLMAGLDYGLTYHISQGYRQVVLLDGDSPTLPIQYLRSAFDALGSVDVVIGPTIDGGYYLLGACRSQPALFRWEQLDSATLCTQTRLRAETLGQRVELLPSWYDIDTPDDLDRLVGDLRSQVAGASRTRQFLVRAGYL